MKVTVKWISLILVAVLAMGMLGCNGQQSDVTETIPNESESVISEESITEENDDRYEQEQSVSQSEQDSIDDYIPDMTYEEALAVLESPETREELYFKEEVGMALYNARTSQENAMDFTGEWSRTNVPTYHCAEVTITNQDENGFDVNGTFFWYSYTGDIINERAYFVTEDLAIYEIYDEWVYELYEGENGELYKEYWKPYEYIAFQRVGDELLIYATGAGGQLGCFSANCWASGEFVQGEPAYTNANILAETYTEAQLEQIRSLVGEELYEKVFVTTTEHGSVTVEECVLEDATEATEYYGIIFGIGFYNHYKILSCENGDIYCLLWGPELKLYSNVPDVEDMPEYMYVREIEQMEALENFKAEYYDYFLEFDEIYLGNYVEQDYCFLTGGDLTTHTFQCAWIIEKDNGRMYMITSYIVHEDSGETDYKTVIYDITEELPQQTYLQYDCLLKEYDFETEIFIMKEYDENDGCFELQTEEKYVLSDEGELILK